MIELFVQSRYKINRNRIRKRVDKYLQKIKFDPKRYSVSIAVVGDRKMAHIHDRFLGKKGTTPVLSFPLIQSGYKDKYHGAKIAKAKKENDMILLGEIIVSYPQTLLYAADENKLVDDKLFEFIVHGLENLLSA